MPLDRADGVLYVSAVLVHCWPRLPAIPLSARLHTLLAPWWPVLGNSSNNSEQ